MKQTLKTLTLVAIGVAVGRVIVRRKKLFNDDINVLPIDVSYLPSHYLSHELTLM